MNTLKSFLTAAIIIVLLIVAGCSDEITSPVTQSKLKKETTGAQEDVSGNVYRSAVKIKPYETYTFSYENTGFYSFNSISVLDCELAKKNTEIYGYLDDEILVLGCNSEGFWVWSISIYNSSSEVIDLDVTVTGSKTRISDPTPKIKNAD